MKQKLIFRKVGTVMPERDDAWLVVIDMQNVFATGSPWASPGYSGACEGIRRLLPAFGERVVYTRYVAPEHPEGAWVPYFEQWPFALVPESDPLYQLTSEFNAGSHPVVTRATFGKWGPELRAATGGARELVLTGVSTDCCVIATALPAADDGVHVVIPVDACAGASDEDHRRALDTMGSFSPLIDLTTVSELLAA